MKCTPWFVSNIPLLVFTLIEPCHLLWDSALEFAQLYTFGNDGLIMSPAARTALPNLAFPVD